MSLVPAEPRFACPHCHRVVAHVDRYDQYLSVVEYREVDLCDGCADELRRLGDVVHYAGHDR